jgi:hypothetical protein
MIAVVLSAVLGASTAADAPLILAEADALLSAGRLADAEAALEPLASRGDPSALLRLSQVRRWSGRPIAAREAALRALALAPDRRDVREEVAWTWVDAGRAAPAMEVLDRAAAAASNQLVARIGELRRASASIGATAYSDNQGIARYAPRVRVDVPLWRDARLSVGGGSTRLSQQEAEWSEGAGAEVAIPLDFIQLIGGAGVHRLSSGALLTEGHAALGLRPVDEFRVELRARRRPFVEGVPILATELEAFHGAGVGGALDLAQVERRGVDELRLEIAAQPFGGSWIYGVGRAFATSDHNTGWSTAVGAGLSVTRLLRARGPLEAALRWDSYLMGFSEPRTAYLSPRFLDAHSPGAELTLHLGSSCALSVEGGPTFSSDSAALQGMGWFGGAGVEVALGRAKLGVRAQARRDPWFESTRAWTRFQIPF